MKEIARKIEALALFDSLAELPAEECNARLAALAASNPDLVLEVRKLLQADAASSGLLDHGIRGVADTVLSALYGDEPELDGLRAGQCIGAFVLLRPLGQGGMGEVWLAERRLAQAEGDFVQQVALKLLKRGMDSEALVRRFVQERKILAELNHPHIARFVDGGISSDGRLYYAMEFVEGVSILEYVKANKLSVRASVQLIAEVCDAVAHAQAHLVVHRDLKPSNILVDQNAQPRVLDFGIAKLLDSKELNQTASEVRAMTPVYAAPEQILGEPISTATDVYALGVILYQLLTGTLPHQRSGALISLAESVHSENIERPSTILRRSAQTQNGQTTQLDPARAAREIAGDLDTILLMALRREPVRRYANAAAFGSDLRAWLLNMPVAAQLDTRGYRMRSFVRRNRAVVGSASAIFLALIAGLSVALWQTGVAREQAAKAQALTVIAQEANSRTQRVKDFMMQIFYAADPMRNTATKPATLAEAFDAALKRIDSDLKDDPKLQIDVLDDFSEILMNQGSAKQALPLINRALKLAETTYPSSSPVIAESLVNRSAINLELDLPAIADLERAVAILEPHALTLPLQFSIALSNLCAVHMNSGDNRRASPYCDRSVAIYRENSNGTCYNFGSALFNAGTVKLNLGRFLEAESLLREAERVCTDLSGANAMPLVHILASIANIEFRKGNLEAVKQINQRRLRILGDVFPGDHGLKAEVATELGAELIEQKPLEAIRYLDQAIAMYERMDSRWVVLPLFHRAQVERNLHGDAAAMPILDRALNVCALKKMDHINCDELRANRAASIAHLGDGKRAIEEVETAMRVIERRGQASEKEYAAALASKSIALYVLGRQADAVAARNQAIALYETLFGKEHPETINARKNLNGVGELIR